MLFTAHHEGDRRLPGGEVRGERLAGSVGGLGDPYCLEEVARQAEGSGRLHQKRLHGRTRSGEEVRRGIRHLELDRRGARAVHGEVADAEACPAPYRGEVQSGGRLVVPTGLAADRARPAPPEGPDSGLPDA